MSFSKIAAVAGAAFISGVAAHGRVQAIKADGVWYEGYDPSFQYDSVAPVVAGWSDPQDLSNGFIAPDAYGTSDIICHLAATNGQGYVNVTAGSDVTLGWTAWPESHHGPVLDYLASCDGDCTTIDKTTLEFTKIDGVGMINDDTVPGIWATDNLIANNNSWVVNIPSSLADGQYVLRHEIIALHSAGQADGAQNYPQCINLWVSGGGSASLPAGTAGTSLYSETDAGIEVNIYASLASYDVPGPTQWASATSSAALASYSATPSGGAATPAATSAAGSSAAASSVVATSAATSSAVVASSSAVAASSPSSAAAAITSSAAAVVATSSAVSSSTKKSCSKAASSAAGAITSAAAAIVTSAPVAGAGNVITQEVTVTSVETDIVTVTVTAGANARRHARDVRA